MEYRRFRQQRPSAGNIFILCLRGVGEKPRQSTNTAPFPPAAKCSVISSPRSSVQTPARMSPSACGFVSTSAADGECLMRRERSSGPQVDRGGGTLGEEGWTEEAGRGQPLVARLSKACPGEGLRRGQGS